MKRQVYHYLMLVSLGCLLLSSCVKCDDPLEPQTPTPDWLLTEVRTIYNYTGAGPDVYTKAVDTYTYNSAHKPWLHVRAISGADTSVLTDAETDTLYYDAQQRVIRVAGYQLADHKMLRQRVFHYNGTERLPASVEFWEKVYDWVDTLTYSHVHYIYQDTVVLSITGTDTARVDYNAQGNFIGWNGYRANTTYDAAPNIESFFNLETGLALNIPDGYGFVRLPLYSVNNWIQEGNFTFAIWRYPTYNSIGQISELWYRDQLKVDLLANVYFTYTAVP